MDCPGRISRDGLRENSSQAFQIDQSSHLSGVAKGARGYEDRIGQTKPAQLYSEIDIMMIHVHTGLRQDIHGKAVAAQRQNRQV